MTKAIIIFNLCCTTLICTAQINNHHKVNGFINVSFISNNKIKYSIGLASCDSCFPISSATIGYRVGAYLTEEQEEIVRKLTSSDWVALLNNNKSDWAANLVLYYIFDKDAIPLLGVRSRKKWLKYLKKEDLEFWDQKFKSSPPNKQ